MLITGGQQQQGGGGQNLPRPMGMGMGGGTGGTGAGSGATGGGTACPAGNGVKTTATRSGDDMWVVSATGCPNYDPTKQTTGNTPTYQNINAQFPANPIISSTKTYVGM